MKENWYLLRCKPKQDSRAAKLLEQQNYEVCCPLVWVNKSKTLTPRNALEPLFPGYIFIRINREHANWVAIRSTSGVRDFVRFGKKIAWVHSDVVDKIHVQAEILSNKPVIATDLLKGDEVFITEGCFQGLKAIYQCRSGKDRVSVLINVLGRLTEASIKSSALEVLI
jgi:transcriptional antiterminator RfaH